LESQKKLDSLQIIDQIDDSLHRVSQLSSTSDKPKETSFDPISQNSEKKPIAASRKPDTPPIEPIEDFPQE
jgi:hypothetical protein